MSNHFIEIESETFKVLHKALFWENQQALLLADLHLGKEAHFRKSGVPVPDEVESTTLKKLEELIEENSPKNIYLLGDLFHHKNEKVVALFNDFCDKHYSIEFILILGNHDRWIFTETTFNCQKEEIISNILLSHEPQEKENYHNICGHVHPAVKLSGKGKQKLTLPCLWHQKKQTILPAFGSFTGNYIIKPEKENQVFVFDENELVMKVM